jgi:hypothetical protein
MVFQFYYGASGVGAATKKLERAGARRDWGLGTGGLGTPREARGVV